MARRTKPGIWAMEGRWSSSVRDVRTVDPLLAALANNGSANIAKHHINTPEDLNGQLRRWAQKQHLRFNIGYIALHGSPGTVHIGRRSVDAWSLADGIPRPKLARKVLHFGSCEVLDLSKSDRIDLRKALGVRAVTGFTEPVDFIESLAFELLLFDCLTYYKQISAAENWIKKNHSAFARRLGFVMIR